MKLNTQFLLKTIQSKEFSVSDFVNKSLLGNENSENLDNLKTEYNNLEEIISKLNIENLKFNNEVNKILKLEKELKSARINRKRKIESQIKNILKDSKISHELNVKKSYLTKMDRLNELDQLINRNTLLLELNLSKQFLMDLNFIDKSLKNIDEIKYEDLKKKGFMATEINECNEILLVEIIEQGYLDDLNLYEIFGLLAIFLKDKMEEEVIISDLDITDLMKGKIREIGELNIKLDEVALKYRLNYDAYLTLTFVVPAYMWAMGIDFKDIYEKNSIEMYEGNFVKNVMKILNICNEIVKVCEVIGKTDLIEKLENIESIILRDIVSFDSIYLLN